MGEVNGREKAMRNGRRKEKVEKVVTQACLVALPRS